jgi:hypothetical protein
MLDDVREMTAKALELTGVQQLSAFESGMIAGLRRELVQAKETAAVALRVAATKQHTIDEQRALIAELTAERDKLKALRFVELDAFDTMTHHVFCDFMHPGPALVAECDKAERKAALASTCIHHAEWPAFPAEALRGGDGILR